ncbi:hypothetical protein [Goodfellowiella coeruleoviolacea]|uniref:Uncharacterized protein n=1 Tax=Goodfellowiella coeruleoviolacea TaxID=334858 RepID=A0AAE3KIQ2_9PSEU|nr:hypothetical protein [Goodfellowiella coeruleoviolacea]MCP2168695.1 hypothetical protein [Goodfellowiella coeruleoviolacea]
MRKRWEVEPVALRDHPHRPLPGRADRANALVSRVVAGAVADGSAVLGHMGGDGLVGRGPGPGAALDAGGYGWPPPGA